ncbi:hypothetical protein GCM10009754_79450 [Amycolatopsis minnesotensis]|uniref:Uncharacterized protein n=2 Tax=Amycolatopsis minnesotensis TaxID=337894 RepID=A0ABN2SMV4_9PSEU
MTNLRSAGGFRFSNLPANNESTSAATPSDTHAVASNTREAAYSLMSPASIAASVHGRYEVNATASATFRSAAACVKFDSNAISPATDLREDTRTI